MMDTFHDVQNLDQGPVTIRALHSLTQQQAGLITRAVAACGPSWTVQACDDYDGYRSILIEPFGQPERPAYYISGTTSQIELANVRHDNLHTFARFDDVRELATRLTEILVP